jgi:hypothetical protein
MIQLEQLEEMFANIAAGAKWDMSRPMLWGYFFTDRSRPKLEAAARLLEQQGYRFVNLFVPELDEGQDEYLFLHVEKEEIHNPQSLHERNGQLEAFADAHELDAYDGMDVGPASRNDPSTKGTERGPLPTGSFRSRREITPPATTPSSSPTH